MSLDDLAGSLQGKFVDVSKEEETQIGENREGKKPDNALEGGNSVTTPPSDSGEAPNQKSPDNTCEDSLHRP